MIYIMLIINYGSIEPHCVVYVTAGPPMFLLGNCVCAVVGAPPACTHLHGTSPHLPQLEHLHWFVLGCVALERLLDCQMKDHMPPIWVLEHSLRVFAVFKMAIGTRT